MRRWLLPLPILALWPAPAGGQVLAEYDYEHLTFRGASVELGRISPTKVEDAMAYTLRLDLGYLGPHVRISPAFSYWSSRIRESELRRLAERLDGIDGVHVSPDVHLGPIDWSSFSASIDGQVTWIAPFGVVPYAGAGLGVHVLDGQGPLIDGTFIEDLLDTVGASVAGLLGVQVFMSSGFHLYGEARYTLLSDIRYGGVHLGGGFVLPSRAAAEVAR